MTTDLTTEAALIREAVQQLDPIGRRRRYSRELRERILSYLDAGASAGGRREGLATAAGVPVKTTDRWMRQRRRSQDGVVEAKNVEPIPVSITDAGRQGAGGGLVLVSRNGVRLEGIDVASAISILRALG